jgi:hypothetical protein
MEERLGTLRKHGHRHSSASPPGARVECRTVLVRTGRSITGEQRVDQPRMPRKQGFVVESELAQRLHAHVGKEHVGARNQLAEDRGALRILEIDRETALATVVQLRRGVFLAAGVVEAGHEAKRIAFWRFNLEDIRAPVAKHRPSRWARGER